MRVPSTSTQLKLAAALVIAGAGWSFATARRRAAISDHPADSAPGRTARQNSFGGYIVTGRTVTVRAEKEPLYEMWRDVSNLPKLLDGVRAATEISPGRWAWTLEGPVGTETRVQVDITEERPGEVLAWSSADGSDIEAKGKLAFSDAPGGRGTRVEATISYAPPMGRAGHWIAKMTGRDPTTLARHALKRMKMLAEAGEIATAANRKES